MLLVRKLFHPEGEQGGSPAPEGQQQKGEKEPASESALELAKALKEAKANSVSKADYDKLAEENKRLVSEIINGEGAGSGQVSPEDNKPTIEELREQLYGKKCSSLSNLEYWEKTLALRDAVIEKEGVDPFLPIGSKISPEASDVEAANRVAEVVKQCIEEAEGNSDVFTALLQSKTKDDSVAMTMHLKKLGIKYK